VSFNSYFFLPNSAMLAIFFSSLFSAFFVHCSEPVFSLHLTNDTLQQLFKILVPNQACLKQVHDALSTINTVTKTTNDCLAYLNGVDAITYAKNLGIVAILTSLGICGAALLYRGLTANQKPKNTAAPPQEVGEIRDFKTQTPPSWLNVALSDKNIVVGAGVALSCLSLCLLRSSSFIPVTL
jgi:hypothetical protein